MTSRRSIEAPPAVSRAIHDRAAALGLTVQSLAPILGGEAYGAAVEGPRIGHRSIVVDATGEPVLRASWGATYAPERWWPARGESRGEW